VLYPELVGLQSRALASQAAGGCPPPLATFAWSLSRASSRATFEHVLQTLIRGRPGAELVRPANHNRLAEIPSTEPSAS